MKKLIFLTLAVLLLPLSLSAGELIFGWNKVNESGTIFDMEFMPDNNFFILSTATDFQIRKTETGELVQTYPKAVEYGAPHNFEFTPDSTRMLYAYGENLELRNLSDMSLLKKFTIPPETDTIGLNIETSSIRFIDMAIDPVRPYVYVIRKRTGGLWGGKLFNIDKVIVYNYKTMEKVKELISFTFIQSGQNQTIEYFNDYTYCQHLAVSKDGKYLALLSEGKSHIRVWDLQTMTLKNQFNLCEEDGAGPCEIKFSDKNTENIYFSGEFPPNDGFFTYSIQENKLILPTWQTIEAVNFDIFDNEEKIICKDGSKILIFVFGKKSIEFDTTISHGEAGLWGRIIHSGFNFIGWAGYYFSMGKYDPETSVSNEPEFKQVVYPNPTNGVVNIKLDCSSENQFYEVYNTNSSLIIPSQKIPAEQNYLNLDFSKYSSGIYFLRIYCGKTFSTYKIVKKG